MRKEYLSLEDYLKEYCPSVLLQYEDYVKNATKYSPEEICDSEIDMSSIINSAITALKAQGIVTYGNLISLLKMYGNLNWVRDIGIATRSKLALQLKDFGIDMERLDLVDEEVIKYAVEKCGRRFEINIDKLLSPMQRASLSKDGITTSEEFVRKFANDDTWFSVHHLMCTDSLGKFAPDIKLLRKEIKKWSENDGS